MLVTGSFAGTGQSAAGIPKMWQDAKTTSRFNLDISGTFVGTIDLQRSFDDGTTWVAVTGEQHTAPVSKVIEEPEDAVQYRLDCSAYTSGTAVYRMSS